MKTAFMLMAQYDGKVVIPIDVICRDYFPQFTPTKFVDKIPLRRIELPLLKLGLGQKATKGIALNDFASYLDNQIDAARKDMEALTST